MDNILTSPEGKKIKEYISPIYDEAYIAQWILQTIGVELDDLRKWVEEYWNQIVPQTATWGLPYWESEYGIPTDSTKTNQQRRNELQVKIHTRTPMNPWRLAQIVSNATGGLKCRIVENTAKNTFQIWITAFNDVQINEEELKKIVNKYKPAHLVFEIMYENGDEAAIYPAAIVRTGGEITIRQVN